VSRILDFLNYQLDENKGKNDRFATLVEELRKTKEQLNDQIKKLESSGKSKDYIEKEDTKIMKILKNTFDGINKKTVLNIELALTILRVNETIRILSNNNMGLSADPWRFDESALRQNAMSCRSLNNL